MLFMYLVCIFTCIYIYIIFWFIMFGLILKLNYLSFLKNSLVPVTVWGTCSFYLQNSQECGLRPRTRKIKVVKFFVTFYSSSKGTGNLKKNFQYSFVLKEYYGGFFAHPLSHNRCFSWSTCRHVLFNKILGFLKLRQVSSPPPTRRRKQVGYYY